MKTAEQGNAKWKASTATGEQTWVDNLNATNKPIVNAAIEARSRMQANFNTATQPGGVWETRLRKVGDAGVKSAATARRSNYSLGVQQGADKQLASMQKIISYETAGLAGLNAIPKGGLGQSKARAAYWIDYMAAGRGTLGA